MKNSAQHLIIGLLCLILMKLNDADEDYVLSIIWMIAAGINFIMWLVYPFSKFDKE